MGKERIQKKRKELLLRMEIEQNNLKSPVILTAVMVARSQMNDHK